ncbi:MAG: aldo/keto reductase [Bacteroidota bacterium]
MIEKIGLGSVQFGLNYGISNSSGITEPKEVARILDYARSTGIELIDTAFGYGCSEEVLGKSDLQGFNIVSKFLPATKEYSVENQINTSLKRMQVSQFYGLLAHRPEDVVLHPEIWEYLVGLKNNKVVRKIGFSFNTPEEADRVLGYGFIPDLIQVPFNYLDHRFLNIILLLKAKGCEIHTRSTFLQGLFFTDVNTLDGFFDEAKPAILELHKHGPALPGLLLKYCLRKTFIDKVILGVNTQKQLSENIGSIKLDGNLGEPEVEIKHEILTPSKWPVKK